MSQDKTDKAKAPLKPDGDAAKRPYATIDGQAREVRPADIPSVAPTASKAAFAKSATAAPTDKPAAPAASAAASKTTAATAPSAKPAASAAAGAAGAAAYAPSSFAGWLPSLISGATGAILTLFGLGSLGMLGGMPQSNQPAAALTERLSKLEQALAAKPTADTTTLEARLAAMETQAKALTSAQTAQVSDTRALEAKIATGGPTATANAERVARLETQLKEIAAAAQDDPQRGRIPALAQITTKLGDLDTQITTRASTLKSELSQDLEKRLAASADTAEQARARLAQRTQSLETTLKSVTDDNTALRASVDGMKSDLDARFKATAKPGDIAAAIEPVTTKLAGLEKNITGIVRSEQDRNATAGNILLSIELANLKRALDRGGKYASELAAVKKVGGDKLNLSVLEAAQNNGVASLATLTTEFRSLAYSILDAEAQPPETASVLDRMVAGAKSVVRVRKVTHAPDDTSTEAIVGRIESFLKDGRFAELLDEGKKLPEKAGKTAQPWLEKIKSRFAIETAVTDLEQTLKTALAGSADAKKGNN